MKNLYSISMTTENALRVLQRVASIFSRNRINIEQLNVFETKTAGLSHFTIAIYSEPEAIEKLLKQLGKMIELKEVHVHHAFSANEKATD